MLRPNLHKALLDLPVCLTFAVDESRVEGNERVLEPVHVIREVLTLVQFRELCKPTAIKSRLEHLKVEFLN